MISKNKPNERFVDNIYEAFLNLERIYSKISEDDLRDNLVKNTLREKDVLNSRDKRKIKSTLKKFNKIKTSIDFALSSIINNIKLIESLDKLVKILDSFEILEDSNEMVINLKDNAFILRNSLLIYRFLVERKVLQDVNHLRLVNDSIFDFNDYLSSKKLTTNDMIYTRNLLNYFHEVPDTLPEYDVDYKIIVSNASIKNNYSDKITLNQADIVDLFNRFRSIEHSILQIQDEMFRDQLSEELLIVKRKVHPQIIVISKKNLNDLKLSEELIKDMEILKEEIDSVHLDAKESNAIKLLNIRIKLLKKKMDTLMLSKTSENKKLSENQTSMDEIIREALALVNNFDSKIGGLM